MVNFKDIVFVNFFHNGDLHLSREFVRKIINKFPEYNYYYAHNNNPYVLNDLKVKHCSARSTPIKDAGFGFLLIGDRLYLNTWYGAIKLNGHGVVFDTLFDLFNFNCNKFLHTDLSQIDNNYANFFPTIDFFKFKTNNIDNYLLTIDKNFERKILFSNGPALSGQSQNFSFGTVINNLAVKYPNYLFIYTNRDNSIENHGNIVCSSNIIGPGLSCDLNENSYLSNFCDVIIGRSSGVYTFSMTQHNMINNKKLMISFSTIGTNDNKYWLGPNMAPIINYPGRIVNYPIWKEDLIILKIEEEMSCFFKS